MKKRTKLADRVLPAYSRGEELLNMITHIVGGVLGLVALLMCVIRTAFSMACYVGVGWCVLPFWRQTAEALTPSGFLCLLLGGIAYTVGAVLYGLGKTRKWMHGVFHIFVVLGSVLQFFAVWLYAL